MTTKMFFTDGVLGSKRERTPEGFLLVRDVPVARTGEMLYGPRETPIQPGPDGWARVRRMPEEVFCPISMSSLNGKPFTNDHPPENVTPQNWLRYAKGTVLNPRRGEGDQSDLLLADVLIHDEATIRDVEAGKVEVSCGYEPMYNEALDENDRVVPGVGYQTQIRYNHLALVRNGRCGSRCAIGDQMTTDEEITTMAAGSARKRKASTMDRIRAFMEGKGIKGSALDEVMEKVEEETAEDNVVEPSPDAPVEIHNHSGGMDMDAVSKMIGDAVAQAVKPINDSIENLKKDMNEFLSEEEKEGEHDEATVNPEEGGKKILGQLEMEAPPGTGDAAKKATDSRYLVDAFKDTAAKAEIIAPGIKVPAFDMKAPPAKTFDCICKLRRAALDVAYGNASTRMTVDAVMGGRALDTKTMSCDAVRATFNSVAAMRAADNNRGPTADGSILSPATAGGSKIKSIADLNKAADERYRGRKAS